MKTKMKTKMKTSLRLSNTGRRRRRKIPHNFHEHDDDEKGDDEDGDDDDDGDVDTLEKKENLEQREINDHFPAF